MDNINKFSAVTTFNFKKHSYGIEMINSFFTNWPDQIKLIAFIENSASIDDSKVKSKILLKDYHTEIPEYKKFCIKFKHKQKYIDDFRFNAFRFAYKIYAILCALKSNKSRYLIWLDADIKTHKKIPLEFFDQLISKNAYMSYLGRENISLDHLTYSECGFLIFDTHHSTHKIFWDEMVNMYSNGLLFYEKEWHDSYIFDQVRKKIEKKYKVSNLNISSLGLVNIDTQFDDHIFVKSILGEYMDHKKGMRKEKKWSPELIKRIKKDRIKST